MDKENEEISEAAWQKRVDKIRVMRRDALSQSQAARNLMEYHENVAKGLAEALDILGEKY